MSTDRSQVDIKTNSDQFSEIAYIIKSVGWMDKK